MRFIFTDFELDTQGYTLHRLGQTTQLRLKVFQMLHYFLKHRGRVVNKQELCEHVWSGQFVSDSTIESTLREIRQALGDSRREQQYIQTIRGIGYRFIAPVTVVGQSLVEHTTAPLPYSASTSSHLSPPTSVLTDVPIVARETELAQLNGYWTQALQGKRQIVFVMGEAGIGKTTLVDAFVIQAMNLGTVWIASGQCIEQYGFGEAYLPLLEALGQLARNPDGARLLALLRQQAPSWLLQMPALLSDTEYEALQQRSRTLTHDHMLRELAEAIEVLTTDRPVLLVLEDLHWSDYATLDWLTFIAHRRVAARLMVVGTYRPADATIRSHPVCTVSRELCRHGQAVELPLPCLSETGVATYLAQRFNGAQLPGALAQVLSQRTDGNPFFLVTIVEELVRQGYLERQDTGWRLQEDMEAVAMAMPESVRQLIERQLTHSSSEAQAVLAAASVVGVDFSAAAVSACLDQTTEDVEAQCDALVRREQFVCAQGMAEWPDGTMSARYGFIHDLYHEIIYDRIPISRRLRWHKQIGDRLEAGYGERSWEVAAELAIHFTRGRDHSRAVHYHKLAAQEALRRWAYQEAMRHLREGLAGIEALSETPECTQQELDYQIALGQALTATKGYGDPDVERTYARARTLCQQVGDPLSVFKVLQGQQLSYLLRGEMQTARELAEQLLILSQRRPDSVCSLVAHAVLGMTLNYLGEFTAARTYLEQGITLSGPEQQRTTMYRYGVIHGVLCRAYASQTMWYLGYPDQARRVADQACILAQEMASPHSLAYAHYHTARLLQLLGEVQVAREHAEVFTTLAQEQKFAQFLAQGTFLKGWMLAAQGQGELGLTQMRQGLTGALATGAELIRPFYLALLAEVHGKVVQTDEGLGLLDEALAAVDKGGQHYCEAELHRLKGQLLLQQSPDNTTEAEAGFHQALSVARQQQAKSWELRAATSLARLWQSQGKRQAAYELLAPVYGWFTEGFDTADLKDAKALLEELG